MKRKHLPAPRALLGRLRGALTAGEDDDRLRSAALSMVGRAERLFDRLDATAQTLEKVAEVELRLVERLVPIVDDLGELVKLTLVDAKRRLGLPTAPTQTQTQTQTTTGDEDSDSDVIDVEAEPTR